MSDTATKLPILPVGSALRLTRDFYEISGPYIAIVVKETTFAYVESVYAKICESHKQYADRLLDMISDSGASEGFMVGCRNRIDTFIQLRNEG